MGVNAKLVRMKWIPPLIHNPGFWNLASKLYMYIFTGLEESKRPDKEGKDTFTLLIVDPPLLTLTEKATST